VCEETNISYTDPISKVTVTIPVNNGVTQGAATSGLLHNLGAGSVLHKLIEEFKEYGIVICYHDDEYIIGQADKVFHIYDLSLELKANLLGQQVNTLKTKVWSRMPYSVSTTEVAAERNLKLIPYSEGLIVVGSPVGSPEFELAFMNRKADEICNTIADIRDMRNHGSLCNSKENRSQNLISYLRVCIIPQFHFLLRTVSPSATLAAAKRIDQRLFLAVLVILNLHDQYLSVPPDSDEAKIIHLTFQQNISAGGMGFTNLEDLAKRAFLASNALTLSLAPKISNLFLFDTNNPLPDIPIFIELNAIIEEFNHSADLAQLIGPITITSLLDQPIHGLQTQLNEKASRRRTTLIDLLKPRPENAFVTNNNNMGRDTYSAVNKEVITQIIGQRHKASGAWLSIFANKSNTCSFTNNIYANAWALRCQIPSSIDPVFCPCGNPLDRNFGHTLICGITSVRSKTRNNHHTLVQKALEGILKHAYPSCLVSTDPPVQEHFERQPTSHHATPTAPRHILTAQEDAELEEDLTLRPHRHQNIHKDVNYRADLLVQTNSASDNDPDSSPFKILVDVTGSHATAAYAYKHYVKAGDAAQQAEEKKRAAYNKHFLFQPNELVIFAFETNGALSVASENLLRTAAQNRAATHGDEYPRTLQCYYQQISHAVQTGRGNQINTTRNHLSLRPDQRLPTRISRSAKFTEVLAHRVQGQRRPLPPPTTS